MTPDAAILKSNKTCRSNGAVGKNAIVPKWVAGHTDPKATILDFGAGKEMPHVHTLRSMGFRSVAGYEFGENITPDHIKVLLPNSFGLIYASNVFNTHSNALMSAQALHLIKNSLRPRCYFVFNLPISPNYFWENKSDFMKLVKEIFGNDPVNVDRRGIYMVKRDLQAEKYLI